MSVNRLFFLLLMLHMQLNASAQYPDTLVYSYADFIAVVKQYHPVARQSDLLIPAADAAILHARGGFDPKIYYAVDQKQFNDQQYWTIQNGGVKLPTNFALELNAGIEQSSGPYLNSESITSEQGMLYTQLSVPLLQGLLIDERRLALKQAQLYRELSLLEQKNLLNDLLSRASISYWEWVQSYYNLQVARESVLLAKQRFDGIKESAIMGDRALIDTLEAGLQFQDRSVMLQEFEMDFYAKTLKLSVFIWNENNETLVLSSNTVPPKIDKTSPSDILPEMFEDIDGLVASHPEILLYANKNSSSTLDLKLKQDKLKPMLNVKFNPLYDLGNFEANIFNGISSYKWGLAFSLPILLRKERGEVQMAKLKLSDLNYEWQNKKVEMANKLKAAVNTYRITEMQVIQYEAVVDNYFRLLESERQLFMMGESSLFMINSRELSYIQSRLKLNDLQFKRQKARVEMLNTSGQLYRLQ